MPGGRDQAADVLDCWFVQTRPRQWFAKDPALDALLRERFLGLTRRAIAGELDLWTAEPTSGLALVLLLDQFPRQIWRGTAMAFAGDPLALPLSLRAVELGWLAELLVDYANHRFQPSSQHRVGQVSAGFC